MSKKHNDEVTRITLRKRDAERLYEHLGQNLIETKIPLTLSDFVRIYVLPVYFKHVEQSDPKAGGIP